MVVKDWYGKGVGLSTTLFYGIFMNVPAFQAQQVETESTSVPFLIFSIYFCNQYLKRGQKRKLLLSGISMSVALLIRQSQIAGIFVLLTMIALANYKSFNSNPQSRSFHVRNMLRGLLILGLGMLIPISIVISYFWTKGIFAKMIECMLLRGYSSGYFSLPNVPFGMKFLILTEGLPLWLFGFLGCIICVSRLNNYDKTSMIWTFSFLLVVLIPPNFGHHFIQIIAPASILSGITLALVSKEARNYSMKSRLPAKMRVRVRSDNARNKVGVLMIVILVLTFLPSIFFQVMQYPNFNIDWEFIHWNLASLRPEAPPKGGLPVLLPPYPQPLENRVVY